MTTDTTTDPELARLLDIIEQGYYEAGRFVRKGQLGGDGFMRAIGAHAALLAHVATRYAQRPPVPALLPTPADVDAGRCRWTEHGWVWTDYRAARGILPWKPGDELPEERIRRLRDGDHQHTLHLDDDDQVVSGAPDFEGER